MYSKLINFFKENNCDYLENEPLKNYAYFRIGGKADILYKPRDEKELIEAISVIRKENILFFMLGKGSNILFSDEGIRGVVIDTSRYLNNFEIKDNTAYAQCGVLLAKLMKQSAMRGLAGGEFASGIPGTIGGAVVMNAGAYTGEIKDILTSATVLTKDNRVVTYSNKELDFQYRSSRVLREESIVLSATFTFSYDDKDAILERIREFTIKRHQKQPLELPSAGSTFKRPVGYFAGKLIDDTGLRGLKFKGAMVSQKHCGFVVNYNNATSNDVKTLIRIIQNRVLFEQGVELETEIKIVDDKGNYQ